MNRIQQKTYRTKDRKYRRIFNSETGQTISWYVRWAKKWNLVSHPTWVNSLEKLVTNES